jgi:hypothetical protein
VFAVVGRTDALLAQGLAGRLKRTSLSQTISTKILSRVAANGRTVTLHIEPTAAGKTSLHVATLVVLERAALALAEDAAAEKPNGASRLEPREILDAGGVNSNRRVIP